MATFALKIIAYDKIFFDGEATSITVPAVDGEIQFLAHHEESIVAVKPGEVRIVDEEGTLIPVVCGSGFLEMSSHNRAELLVDTIETPEEIDIRRAQEAKERAEEKMILNQSIKEYTASTASLSRAMARLKTAGKYANKI